MEGQIKGCPFCSQSPEAIYKLKGEQVYEHRCSYIKFTGFLDDWNKRPVEEALAARVHKLEKTITKIKAECRIHQDVDLTQCLENIAKLALKALVKSK